MEDAHQHEFLIALKKSCSGKADLRGLDACSLNCKYISQLMWLGAVRRLSRTRHNDLHNSHCIIGVIGPGI